MKIDIKPGTYVVAVSGGVDSAVLLHRLQAEQKLQLIVAHFDHGIRAESKQDRLFVEKLAHEYGLPFVYDEGKLGADASEEIARSVRYKFLRRVMADYDASSIVTAHHKDDVLETAVINSIRGTGRRGLSSLSSTHEIARPLLQLSKSEILKYAAGHKLEWREDSTNADSKYLRNHIRHNVLPLISREDQDELHRIISELHTTNDKIDFELQSVLKMVESENMIDRKKFINLPYTVSAELLLAWLRSNNIYAYDKKSTARLVQAAKIKAAGKRVNVTEDVWMNISKDFLALSRIER